MDQHRFDADAASKKPDLDKHHNENADPDRHQKSKRCRSITLEKIQLKSESNQCYQKVSVQQEIHTLDLVSTED